MSGRMNPNASSYSPSSLAMIKHGGAVKASDLEAGPRDLIVHESLKHLIQEVQELKLRSSNLEDENAQLKDQNEHFKLELGSLKKGSANGSAAPAVRANLTAYAASDTSSTDLNANGASNANVTANGSDTASLAKRVDEHQDAVNAILEKFNEYLMTEISKREELEKRVNQFQYVLREVKGRVGVLEPKFKGMQTDMDDLEGAVAEVRNDNSFMAATTQHASGPSGFFQDQIERLGGSVKAAMTKLKELEGDVDMHRMIINELNSKAESDGSKFDHQNPGGDGWATSSSNANGKAVSKSETADVAQFYAKVRDLGIELQALQQTLDNRLQEERAIDNCPTKEALYEKFQNYSKDVDQTQSSTAYYDHVWAMRDRVVSRLAIFKEYGKAIQEARTADIGL